LDTTDIGRKIAGRLENDLYLFPDRIICQANYYLEQDHGLFSWIILPKGSKLNADKIFVYRGQHNEIGTGQEFSPQQVALFTSTKSCNWIYSPLSPRIFLKKQDKIIGLGGTRVANDYGIELNTDFSKIKFFQFNYGGKENPFPGEKRQIAVFCKDDSLVPVLLLSHILISHRFSYNGIILLLYITTIILLIWP